MYGGEGLIFSDWYRSIVWMPQHEAKNNPLSEHHNVVSDATVILKTQQQQALYSVIVLIPPTDNKCMLLVNIKSINMSKCMNYQGPPLRTWINFVPSMDKSSRPL